MTANEEEFIRKAMKNSTAKQSAELKKAKKTRTQSEKRIAELDRLFTRLYEDNVSGKISDERFEMMSANYEDEQKRLKITVSELTAFLANLHLFKPLVLRFDFGIHRRNVHVFHRKKPPLIKINLSAVSPIFLYFGSFTARIKSRHIFFNFVRSNFLYDFHIILYFSRSQTLTNMIRTADFFKNH